MNVSVIGGGYVGLVTGACLSELGHNIEIVELDETKVARINKRDSPIYEEGLSDILNRHTGKRLIARSDYNGIPDSLITFICVGTPESEDGSANLNYIISASQSIGKALKGSKKPHTIIVKSTVPPGTTENIVAPEVIAHSGRPEGTIRFGMNPEFLREGRAVYDFFHPDRIVIGTNDARTFNEIKELYADLKAPILHTSLVAAEMIKYTSNAFLATKISFSNEIGNICKKLGIDVYEVMEGVGLDSRIGPLFLNAGAGFGGSCFPKDVSALIRLAKSLGYEPDILSAVMKVNEAQPERLIEILKKHLSNLKNKRICILGLAFKDNTDDIRESRALVIIRLLLKESAEIIAFDPLAMDATRAVFPEIEYAQSAAEALNNADACLIMTEWPEFSSLNSEFEKMKTKVIIEGRKVLKRKDIEGICW